MNIPDLIKQNNCIILFDGVCNLCSGFMQFVYKRDIKGRFKFAWLQDDKTKEILVWLNLGSESFKTIILIEGGKPYYKSSAFLQIVRYLRFPWPYLIVGHILPEFIRDWIYDFVAENRYKWFGKKEKCMVPKDDLLNRFLWFLINFMYSKYIGNDEMILNKILLILIVLIFCYLKIGFTQDSHYWTNQYGTDAQLLGGLVVAVLMI